MRSLRAVLATVALVLAAGAQTASAAPGDGPCTEAVRQSMPDGGSHDHRAIAEHRFACRVEQVAFDPLTGPLADRPDVLLGEMDVKAGRAAIAVSYPESGFLLYDVSDPARPRFLSWYRGSECEGLVIDVDCGAYVDLSADGSTVFMAVQNTSAVPGGRPRPGTTLPKPTSVPSVEVVDVSRPQQPQLSYSYPLSVANGGVHTARSHVVPDGPNSGPRAPGEYVFSVSNGEGIDIAKVGDGPVGAVLEPVSKIPLDEAHDTFIDDDPITGRTYLYVAAGFDTGFVVYDVTDPANPTGPLAEWDLTPGCETDWYSHTIDVTYRGSRRYVTMPAELFNIPGFGEQSEEDQQEGCGKVQGNGDRPGPMWIVDASDFGALGRASDDDAELQRRSEAALVTTWTNPAGRPAGNLMFSPHNQQIVGDRIYLSGYHGGVTVLDASGAFAGRGERPQEVGLFVPAGQPERPLYDADVDPVIPFVSSFGFIRPNVWDMYVYRGHILTADMTGGFYSLQYEGDAPPAQGAGGNDDQLPPAGAATGDAQGSTPSGCARGFAFVRVQRVRKALRLRARRCMRRSFTIKVLRGKKTLASYRLRQSGALRWRPRARLGTGPFTVRFKMGLPGGGVDARTIRARTKAGRGRR